MLGLNNRTILDTTMLKSNGIPICEGPISQFFTTVTNGVQGIPMMTTYPTKYVHATMAQYLISIRNDEIPIILIEKGYFHNTVHTNLIETLEGHHFNGFKVIHVSSNAQKSIMVNPNVEMQVNLLPKTLFHNVIIITFVPPDPRGDPLKPLEGATIAFMQPVIPYFWPLKRLLNYP
jgi:hypothetical protein